MRRPDRFRASMKATPEDVAKVPTRRESRSHSLTASMKATPEDVAKHGSRHHKVGNVAGLNEGHARRRGEDRREPCPNRPASAPGLNEGHARRRGEVERLDIQDMRAAAASMKATPEDVAKPKRPRPLTEDHHERLNEGHARRRGEATAPDLTSARQPPPPQ